MAVAPAIVSLQAAAAAAVLHSLCVMLGMVLEVVVSGEGGLESVLCEQKTLLCMCDFGMVEQGAGSCGGAPKCFLRTPEGMSGAAAAPCTAL